jgi:hypothetical protein
MLKNPKRVALFVLFVIALLAGIVGVLLWAQLGTTETTKSCAAIPLHLWIGCAMAAHENLAGGLIGAAGALIAGLLAWRGLRDQIDAAEANVAAQRWMGVQMERQMLRQEIPQLERAAELSAGFVEKLERDHSPASPYANKLVEVTAAHSIPTNLNQWTNTIWGSTLSTSINRLQTLGHDVRNFAAADHIAADQRPAKFAAREAHAEQAIREFIEATNSIPVVLEERRKRLAELERLLKEAGQPLH